MVSLIRVIKIGTTQKFSKWIANESTSIHMGSYRYRMVSVASHLWLSKKFSHPLTVPKVSMEIPKIQEIPRVGLLWILIHIHNQELVVVDFDDITCWMQSASGVPADKGPSSSKQLLKKCQGVDHSDLSTCHQSTLFSSTPITSSYVQQFAWNEIIGLEELSGDLIHVDSCHGKCISWGKSMDLVKENFE